MLPKFLAVLLLPLAARADCQADGDVASTCAQFDSLQGAVQGCAVRCIISGTSCMQSCVQNLGFSNSCASCWVSLASCTKSKCVWDCLNPTSSSCTKCAQDKCFPDLLSCSGFACNQLPGCESDSAKTNLPGCTSSLQELASSLQPHAFLNAPPLETAAVPTITLNNGVEMPVLALGTGGFDNASAAAAVGTAASAGLTHVHSAFDYYNLPGVGRGVNQRPRASTFLTSMTSPCVHLSSPPQRNVTDPDACYDLTLQEAHAVLALLNTSYVDLLLLHGPSAPSFGYEGACSAAASALNAAQWRAYADFMRAGKARAIGVSNYCASCLEGLGAPVPAVNQIQVHVGTGADPEGLLSYCKQQGIAVQAYSPLAHGAVVSDPLCEEGGAAANRSAAQVGLRWVLDRAPSLVVKASKKEYLLDDLDVFGWALPPAAIAELDAATTPQGQQEGRPSWGCAK